MSGNAPTGGGAASGGIAPDQWASGDNLWLGDAVAPFGGRDEVLATLKRDVFGDRKVKCLQPSPGGLGFGVVEW